MNTWPKTSVFPVLHMTWPNSSYKRETSFRWNGSWTSFCHQKSNATGSTLKKANSPNRSTNLKNNNEFKLNIYITCTNYYKLINYMYLYNAFYWNKFFTPKAFIYWGTSDAPSVMSLKFQGHHGHFGRNSFNELSLI